MICFCNYLFKHWNISSFEYMNRFLIPKYIRIPNFMKLPCKIKKLLKYLWEKYFYGAAISRLTFIIYRAKNFQENVQLFQSKMIITFLFLKIFEKNKKYWVSLFFLYTNNIFSITSFIFEKSAGVAISINNPIKKCHCLYKSLVQIRRCIENQRVFMTTTTLTNITRTKRGSI